MKKGIWFYLLMLFTENILACIDISLDNTQNFENCLKAAEQGDAISQFHLGVMYSQGQGTGKNNQKAVEWFRKSAESSDQLQHIYQGKRSVKAEQRGINQLIEAYGKISNLGPSALNESLKEDPKISCLKVNDELSQNKVTFSTEYFNVDNPLSTASSTPDKSLLHLQRQLKQLQMKNSRLQRQLNDLKNRCDKD